jgi:hypothetical protein
LNNTAFGRRVNSGQLFSGWLGLAIWTFLVARYDDAAIRFFDTALVAIAEWRGVTP